MPPSAAQDSGPWLTFSLLTVFFWGVYGILLHTGTMAMADQVNGRFKAFLFVGLAYFIVAVIAPFLLLVLKGANWKYPIGGMSWSLVAGIAGAIGAFGVLLAFGAKGSPAVVMAIVFAGAPVVNALVAITLDPPVGGWGTISMKFWLGIILAAAGGCLVTLNKPAPGHGHGPAKKPATVAVAAPAAAESAH